MDGKIVPDESVYLDPSTSQDKTSTSQNKTSTSHDQTSTSHDKTSTSQNETDEESELTPEEQESEWTRPTPPLPATVASCIFEFIMTKRHNRGAFEEVVKYLRRAGSPADLINESLVHWLFVSTALAPLLVIAERL